MLLGLIYYLSVDIPKQLIAYAILNMASSAVPPALAIFLTFCQTLGLYRLQLNNVFAMDSDKLLQSGLTSIACFDKTGTLTTNSHEMLGFCDLDCDPLNLICDSE